MFAFLLRAEQRGPSLASASFLLGKNYGFGKSKLRGFPKKGAQKILSLEKAQFCHSRSASGTDPFGWNGVFSNRPERVRRSTSLISFWNFTKHSANFTKHSAIYSSTHGRCAFASCGRPGRTLCQIFSTSIGSQISTTSGIVWAGKPDGSHKHDNERTKHVKER